LKLIKICFCLSEESLSTVDNDQCESDQSEGKTTVQAKLNIYTFPHVIYHDDFLK
jgi:hypothetical protein